MESFLQWDPAQVLSYIKGHIGQDVSSLFIDNNIDGLLLPYITCEHLRELGIEPLATRLKIKKAIHLLIAGQQNSNHTSLGTPGATSTVTTPGTLSVSTNFNNHTPTVSSFGLLNNQVSLEAITLCQILVQDVFKKTTQAMAAAPLLTTPGSAVLTSGSLLGSALTSTDDIRKLNENFIKLKADLNPVIRLIKDSKPLPTPTLDPGIASAPLPTLLTNSRDHEQQELSGEHPQLENLVHSLSAHSINTNLQDNSHQHPPSPTQSRRLSSGSVLSMGVGKITDLSGKLSLSHRLFNEARLIDSRLAAGSPMEDRLLPRDVDEIKRIEAVKPRRSLSSVLSPTSHYFHGNHSSHLKPTQGLNVLTPLALALSQSTQPLKQLKASSDDTCLKVLQQAMKRHHIPRNHWSKYVLVICYGDKERILKLTEKPVIVFKELQEHGKNPAIMLRELAPAEPDGSDKYEDSRIQDEIPGGTL